MTPENDAEFIIEGEIGKADEEKRMVFGWAYISHDRHGHQVIDKSGEFVSDPSELETAAYNFVLNSRVGKDFHDLMKSEPPAAELVESFVFTPEKQEALGIPDGVVPTGWWVGFKVHDDHLWNQFKSGNRKMFSIHGRGKARLVA